MAAAVPTPCRFRRATMKDHAALRRLFAFTGMVGGTEQWDWKRVLKGEQLEVVVAEGEDKTACGYAIFECKWAGKIHLQDIVVDPAMRGRGIAKGLLQYVIDQAQSRHSPEVYLEVKSTNTTAMGLYESLGFRTRFVVPGLIEGADLVAMYLPLQIAESGK